MKGIEKREKEKGMEGGDRQTDRQRRGSEDGKERDQMREGQRGGRGQRQTDRTNSNNNVKIRSTKGKLLDVEPIQSPGYVAER